MRSGMESRRPTKDEIREAIRGAKEEIRRLEEEKVLLDNKIRALQSVIAGYQAYLHGAPVGERTSHVGVDSPRRLRRGQSLAYVTEALRSGCQDPREIVDWIRDNKEVTMTRAAVSSVLRRLVKAGAVVRDPDGAYRLSHGPQGAPSGESPVSIPDTVRETRLGTEVADEE